MLCWIAWNNASTWNGMIPLHSIGKANQIQTHFCKLYLPIRNIITFYKLSRAQRSNWIESKNKCTTEPIKARKIKAGILFNTMIASYFKNFKIKSNRTSWIWQMNLWIFFKTISYSKAIIWNRTHQNKLSKLTYEAVLLSSFHRTLTAVSSSFLDGYPFCRLLENRTSRIYAHKHKHKHSFNVFLRR